MGEITEIVDEHDGAVQHLTQALEAEDTGQKQFHVRQALQLLGVATVR